MPRPPYLYTLSLHAALPISVPHHQPADLHVGVLLGPPRQPLGQQRALLGLQGRPVDHRGEGGLEQDRKSTRLNSSHSSISYAVFCLKKKKKKKDTELRYSTI